MSRRRCNVVLLTALQHKLHISAIKTVSDKIVAVISFIKISLAPLLFSTKLKPKPSPKNSLDLITN